MFTVKYGSQYIHNPGSQDNSFAYNISFDLTVDSDKFCEFTLYPGHPLYSLIKAKDYSNPVTAYDGNKKIFEGFLDSKTKELYNNIRFSCKEGKAFLKDSAIPAFKKTEETIDNIVDYILSIHNSQTGQNFRASYSPASIASTVMSIDNTDFNSAYDIFKNDILTNKNFTDFRMLYNGNHEIVFTTEYSTNEDNSIDFGVNMIDYTLTESYDEIATVLVPTGAKMRDEETGEEYFLTIEDIPDGPLESGYSKSGVYIFNETAVTKYGIIVKNHSNQNIESNTILLNEGLNVLKDLSQPNISIEIKAIDLAIIDNSKTPISVGEKVRITSAFHDIDDTYVCTRIDIDTENPENSVYIFGKNPYSFTNFYEKDRDDTNSQFNEIDTPKYSISVYISSGSGSVELDKTSAAYNDIVTLDVIDPDRGYFYYGGTVIFTIDDVEHRTYLTENDTAFRMPDADVRLEIIFHKQMYDIEVENRVKIDDEHYEVVTPIPPVVMTEVSNIEAQVGDQITVTLHDTPDYTSSAVEVVEDIFPPVQNPNNISVNQDVRYWFEMPGAPKASEEPDMTWFKVKVIGWYEVASYEVKIAEVQGGTPTADLTTARVGQTVTLTTGSDAGYTFNSVSVVSDGGTIIQVSNNHFSMPADNVTVTCTYSKNRYTITCANSQHGIVSALPSAEYNDEVIVTATPDTDYELDYIQVVTSGGERVTVHGTKFTMPASNVTITGYFILKPDVDHIVKYSTNDPSVGHVEIFRKNHTKLVFQGTVTEDSTNHTKSVNNITITEGTWT